MELAGATTEAPRLDQDGTEPAYSKKTARKPPVLPVTFPVFPQPVTVIGVKGSRRNCVLRPGHQLD